MIQLQGTDKIVTIVSFLAFLFIFLLIGALSALKRKKGTADYLVAGQTVKPWLAGLSGVATNNSGYMFVGMIGYTYSVGLSSIWLMIGWILGDIFASLIVMKSMRSATDTSEIQSYGDLISRWWGQHYRVLQTITGLMIVVFLGSYTAAQLTAGSKALNSLFGWNDYVGALIGAFMVLIYSFAGGLRASIWTDAAQSFVMIISMGLLMVIGIMSVGGVDQALSQLNDVSQTYMNWFPENSTFMSALLFVVGWFFAGMGVAGQPHITVRYMSLDDPKSINRMRFYYYGWFILFYGATIIVGLLSKIVIPEASNFDQELALPAMSMKLLSPIFVGVMLAGLFSATMSTADSLVISCSASISRDLFPNHKFSYGHTKLATVFVVIVALAFALSKNDSVFELVLVAWGLLAAAFVPIFIIYSVGYRPLEWQSILVVAVGVAVFMCWTKLGLTKYVMEYIPSIIIPLLVFIIIRLISGQRLLPNKKLNVENVETDNG